jgi:hypothetical protein
MHPDEWEFGEAMYDGSTVLISKVGGGTLGRAYDGYWHYSVSRRDRHMVGSDLYTGSPTTHYSAARIAHDFFTQED